MISSSADKINFRITNSNLYPITLDIVYKGNVISTGITVPANTNYAGTFDILRMFMTKFLMIMVQRWILK